LKISFSNYLMKQNTHIRIAFLVLYVVVALTAASLCGKAYAKLHASSASTVPLLDLIGNR
jgi:hypothetical protein